MLITRYTLRGAAGGACLGLVLVQVVSFAPAYHVAGVNVTRIIVALQLAGLGAVAGSVVGFLVKSCGRL